MADAQRLRRLREAAFRAKAGPGCRICKGVTPKPSHAYCFRHFMLLTSGQIGATLKLAVTKGERLDEADDLIRLHEQFPNANYADDHNSIDLGSGLTLHCSSRDYEQCWILRRMNGVEETELGAYKTVADAMRAMTEMRQDLSTRNRYAKKAMVR